LKREDIKPMTPFDSLTQNESMRMIKLLIPFLSPSLQKMLSVYIKYTEFQNTLQYFRDFGAPSDTRMRDFSFTDILEEIRPYMSEQEGASIDSILSAMQMMDMMKDMGSSPFDFGSFGTEDNENSMEKEESDHHDELDGESPLSGSGSFEAGTDPERSQTDFREDRP
jgi:hypothetical protein